MGFRKHHPTEQENVHASILSKFKFKYVNIDHIIAYLMEVKIKTASDTNSNDDIVDFNSWLHAGPLVGTMQALFRGTIDQKTLELSGVNFADGVFATVDFCYTVFRHVTISKLQKSRLVGCSFVECTATGDALSGSDLSCSRVDHCNFQGLCGVITLNYGVLSHSSFAKCSFTVTSFTGKNGCICVMFIVNIYQDVSRYLF